MEVTASGWTATDADLNPAQRQACETLDGQLLVLAGPGTGKTRVITYRYANLLAQPGVDTDSVVVLAYNEKAAREMQERIITLCQTGFKDLQVKTFHAFALGLLRENGGALPIPRHFRIASDVDQWTAMCRVLERTRPPALYHLPRPRDVAPDLIKLLQRAKQEMAGPAEYRAVTEAMAGERQLGAETQEQIAQVYSDYQAELMGAGLLDFDDTIYWSVRMLETDAALLRGYRERFSHLMVDEFQDTNFAQLRLVEILAGENGNIAVVGDDDQSIYKFRGASVANLRRFRKVYPGLTIVRLEANYRSTRQVLEPAHRMIEHNTERVAKRVSSEREGPAPRLYSAPSAEHEVAWTVERILGLLEGPGQVAAGEIVVLVRTNAHLRPYMRALQRAGIPYQLSGGRGFLDQPEVKDIRAFLQVAADPKDSLAACRILAMPGVALPASLILRIAATARRDDQDIEVVAAAMEMEEPHAASVARVREVLEDVRALSLRERADEVTYRVLELTRYVNLLDYPSEIQRRQAGANIDKFYELARAFSEVDRTGETATLSHFVDYLRAVEESAAEQGIPTIDTGADAVQLMTVHKAKGLEFTAVFCPGMVEERFPFRQQPDAWTLPVRLVQEEAPSRDARLAEERRLAYVALTRARSHLFLSHAERYEGGKRWKPSRFLHELGFLPGPDGRVPTPLRSEAAPVVEPAPPPPAAQPALPMSHPEVPELQVSYSQLAAYRRCPRAYQYEYVYRLPRRPSPEQQFGVIVHETLRQVLGAAGERQPPLAQVLETFDSLFAATPFCDPVNVDLWQERGRQFLRELHARGRLSGKSLHLAPEQAFNLRLPGFRVRGRIDRIDRAERGYRVIDYKTGEVKQEWELERDLQLGLYAVAARQVLGLDPVELAICYLEDAVEIPVFKTTSQIEADLAAAADAAAGITAADFTPAPTAWKCRACDYRMVCDAAL